MKKITRLLLVALILCLIVSSALSVVSANNGKDDAGVSAFAKNIVVGTGDISFSEEDFTSKVSKEAQLEGIVITMLPDVSAGVLKVGEREIMAGEAVISAKLGELRFVPSSSEALMETSFSFLPVFKTGAGSENVSVSLNVLNLKNNPPSAEPMSLSTYKNVPICGALIAVDPEGDSMTFKLTAEPKRGAVKLDEKTGKFEFTPTKNKTGKDSFAFVAIDKFGNLSEPAVIEIKIEKSKTQTVYADMEHNPSHYAAIKMAEQGVFMGEKISDSYFFRPDQPVSRGEFVAMTVSMLGMDNLPVSRTGFADDDSTPAWVKPYVSTALKAGMIKGVTIADGRKEFRSESQISRAEAAVIINNAINLADNIPKNVFSDDADVPSWAVQATINVAASGIINGYGDGTLRPGEAVTRAQAASLLCAALEVREAQTAKGGLLGWAKK